MRKLEPGKERPYTTGEFFEKICCILKEKEMIPEDILDYKLKSHQQNLLDSHELELRNNLEFGSNEGIYLALSVQKFEEEKYTQYKLGTFKTLLTSREAMHKMSGLLADFLVEMTEYVNSHLDEFTWTGVNVYPVKEDGTRGPYSFSCNTFERALLRKDELLKNYPKVVIRDNKTRKITEYTM